MAPEITLEQLAENLERVTKIATKLEKANEDRKEHEKEAKKAMDKEHEEEHKKARKAMDEKLHHKISKAMEEEDHEKRDAAIKTAMEEHEREKHEAASKYGKKGEHDEHHNHDKPEHHAETEEEKEEHANIASIIAEKKIALANKILTANKYHPNFQYIESKVKSANITELQEMEKLLPVNPAQGQIPGTPEMPQQPVIPYFASVISPEEIDANTLTASSPTSQFAQLKTADLMKELQS